MSDLRERFRAERTALGEAGRDLQDQMRGYRSITTHEWAGPQNHPLKDLGGKLVAADPPPNLMHAPPVQPQISEDEKAALELIGEKPPESEGPTAGDLQVFIAKRYELLSRAIELLERRIETARLRASALVCEQVETQHSKLVKTVCTALVALVKADKEYRELTDTLQDDGVQFSRLAPVYAVFLGGHRGRPDRYDHVSYFLKQAVSDGHLAASAVPSELRQ